MSAIELRSAVKRFGDTAVLTGVDLSAPEGSITAVLGASGSGKTTLLRLIAGFERLDSGSLSIGDRIVDDGVDAHGDAASVTRSPPPVNVPPARAFAAEHHHVAAKHQLRVQHDGGIVRIGMHGLSLEPEGTTQEIDRPGGVGIAQAWDQGVASGHGSLLDGQACSLPARAR